MGGQHQSFLLSVGSRRMSRKTSELQEKAAAYCLGYYDSIHAARFCYIRM
jgi:hypothetical protein